MVFSGLQYAICWGFFNLGFAKKQYHLHPAIILCVIYVLDCSLLFELYSGKL